MKREILTYSISEDQIHEELKFFEEYFIQLGYLNCEILFGAFWGNEYYQNQNDWKYEKISIKEIAVKVKSLEEKKIGYLGRDDLFIKIEDLAFEFLFCNDSDIHIKFDEGSDVIEDFYNHWKTLGYSPAEWEKSETGKPVIRLRIN